ncbi:ABC transporter ATP-binding protein [Candidatus Poriferisodalis sp.]|uniref:ABC transporter ATP-binding protein n=1 Tax=Candidatus Poriferisodalis sp. TaxID=3101277 RepID=UPI003D0E67E7
MVMASVHISGLRVKLGGTPVLRGVDLSVSAGEWVNVIGPNGAGKTTLLRSLLSRSLQGVGTVEGRVDIDGLADRRPANWARTVAYVPQVPVIPAGMTVADYVLLGRTPHRGVFSAITGVDRAVAAEVLERLDLTGFAAREVRSLSGGERQRAVMARALAQQAAVLLLDEPTTALDLGHQQEVLNLVDDLRRERQLTVIATLHDLTLAARYGDRIALLAAGRFVTTGSPAEVLTVGNIAEHFCAEVRIIDDPHGPVIVPATSAARSSPSPVPSSPVPSSPVPLSPVPTPPTPSSQAVATGGHS